MAKSFFFAVEVFVGALVITSPRVDTAIAGN